MTRLKNTVAPVFTDEERDHADMVVSIVGPIIPGLARAFGPRTEVLLHNLTKVPNSVEVIAQSITGRSVGSPPTDLGLKTFQAGATEDLIGYRTELGSGLVMRSSSLFFRSPAGRSVAALCINSDIQELLRIQDYLQSMTATVPGAVTGDGEVPTETFPTSVEMLADGLLRDAIAATGVEVELMKKSHKLDVVRELGSRGFFTLKEAVDLAAERLSVSRYTIYNYLNELQDGEGASDGA